MSRDAGGNTSFNEGLARLLARVTCRLAETAAQKEEVFRLRYRSYRREGTIGDQADGRFVDRYDDMPNSWSFSVHVDGQIASALRLSLATRDCTVIPAADVFPDIVRPWLDAGLSILDPTRFVVEATQAKLHPKLPYVTLRLAFLASEFLEADLTLATVRTEHQAFYKRLLGYRLICPARHYPSLLKPISLMSLDREASRARGYGRYPFLASSEAERDALFGAMIHQLPTPLRRTHAA